MPVTEAVRCRVRCVLAGGRRGRRPGDRPARSTTSRSRPASIAFSLSSRRASRNIPRPRISSCSATAISRSTSARPGPRARAGRAARSAPASTPCASTTASPISAATTCRRRCSRGDRRRARSEEHEGAQLHPVQSRHALQLSARQPAEEDPHRRPRQRPARQSDQAAGGREDQVRLVVPRRLRPAQSEAARLHSGDAGRQDARARYRRPLSSTAAASSRPTSTARRCRSSTTAIPPTSSRSPPGTCPGR